MGNLGSTVDAANTLRLGVTKVIHVGFQDDVRRRVRPAVYVRYKSLFGSSEKEFNCNHNGEFSIPGPPPLSWIDDLFARSPEAGLVI
jgi:hypothetical protein